MTMRKNCDAGRSAATLGGIALSGLLGTTFLCGAAPAMAAADGDVLDLSGLERVADSSLGDMRGGFRVGAVDITFGVQITTSVNGQEILQTNFNMTNAGQFSQTTTTLGGSAGASTSVQTNVNNGGVSQAAPQLVTETVSDIAQDLGGSESTQVESMSGGGALTGFQPASEAPLPTASATEPAGTGGSWTFSQTGNGVQAVSADFATAIVHEITSAVTANITNTADNQTITNDTQLDLFINNFEAVQLQSVTNQVISNMMTEMTNAGALGN